MAFKTILSQQKKKNVGLQQAPLCDVCKTKMKPSYDDKNNPIWVCPLDPTHGTKPRTTE